MALTERTYTIPLRKEFQKAPKYKRAKKAVNAVREFMQKHMKSDDVLIGPKLNLKLWEHGIKNPPHHIKVTAVKDDKGAVRVELFGFEFKPKEKKEKKEKPKGIAGKIQEKLGTKEEEAPKEKATTKKDIKEIKKGVEKKEEKKEAEKKEEAKEAVAEKKEVAAEKVKEKKEETAEKKVEVKEEKKEEEKAEAKKEVAEKKEEVKKETKPEEKPKA